MVEMSEDSIQRVIELLEKIDGVLRAAFMPQIRERMESVLDSEEKRKAFHYSDDRGSQEVGNLSGTSYTAVTEWWKEWHRSGLGHMKNVRGGKRFVRDISLEDVGIPLP